MEVSMHVLDADARVLITQALEHYADSVESAGDTKTSALVRRLLKRIRRNETGATPTGRPLVVVEVSGGLADVARYGDVDVLTIDWDAFESTDPEDAMEELRWIDEDRVLIERIPDPEHRQRILDGISAQRVALARL